MIVGSHRIDDLTLACTGRTSTFWSPPFYKSYSICEKGMSQPCLPVPRRRKRKNEQLSSEDDDVRFDRIQSMDAAEYLSRVVQQAKSMPNVCIAKNVNDEPDNRAQEHVPIDGSAASLSYLTSGRTDLTAPPSVDHLPKDPVWIESTISSFENLRNYLETCKARGIGGKKTTRMAFPPMKERAGWHRFCVGKDEATGNTNSYFGDDYKDENNAVDEIPAWERYIPAQGHSPSVRIVLQMDQVLVRRVLSHLSHYICEGWSLLGSQRLAWIYALLARLEKPIHRDDAVTLFALLKVLTRARSRMKMDERNTLGGLNVLIVLIGVYFEQGGGIAKVMTHKNKP
jgi:survival of motor neuron protein-interacting protein 1